MRPKENNTLTFTNCLLETPSEPTQVMIFGKFIPPANLKVGSNFSIVTTSWYSHFGSMSICMVGIAMLLRLESLVSCRLDGKLMGPTKEEIE